MSKKYIRSPTIQNNIRFDAEELEYILDHLDIEFRDNPKTWNAIMKAIKKCEYDVYDYFYIFENWAKNGKFYELNKDNIRKIYDETQLGNFSETTLAGLFKQSVSEFSRNDFWANYYKKQKGKVYEYK